MISTKSADKKRRISAVLAIAFAIIYFAVWAALASPFRAFPGDDGYAAKNLVVLSTPSYGLLSVLEEPTPAYYLLAYSVFKSCGVLVSAGCHAGEVILLIAVASNAAIVLLLGLLIFRLTRSFYAQFAVQAIYGFAAWPVTYHFMVSYTVTTAALVLLVFYLTMDENQEARLRWAVAGIASALVLWSSSAGPLTAGVLILAVVFQSWRGHQWRELLSPSQYDLRRLGYLAIGFVFCAVCFGYFGLPQYVAHLQRNLHSIHYAAAYQRFGYVPQPPFFTYLHILGVYGRVELAMFVAAFTALPFLATRNLKERGIRQAAIVLGVFVLLHAVLIDLLPTTKLARTHFPAYPVSVAVMGITGFLAYRWWRELIKDKRVLPGLLISVALISLMFEGAHLSAETRRVRTTAAEYVDRIRGTGTLVVLQEDPAEDEMMSAFDWQFYRYHLYDPPQFTASGRRHFIPVPQPEHIDQMIHTIDAQHLQALLTGPHSGHFVLLLGPNGHGSGLSLVNKNDFFPADLLNFNLLSPMIKETKVLPYYMHYPPFLLEEEICEALYFDGKIPDYRNPSMGITVLRF